MNKKIFAGLTAAFFCFSACFPASAFAQQYAISGTVSDKNDDSPLEDVEIKISGDRNISQTTDGFGYYRIEDLDGGSYLEVSAVKDGWALSPEIFKISSLKSNRTINFTASQESDQKTRQASKSKSASASSKSASAAGKSSAGSDVPVLAKPASGVSHAQPTYVSETKPFFASSQNSKTAQEKNDGVPKPFFDLSGKVVYYSSGLVGVKVMINNDRKLITTTDVNGYYSFKGLKSGQDYTVVFSRDGYIFDPAEYKIDGGYQDFIINAEASAGKYVISGKVSEGKIGVEDVNIKIISGVDEFSAYTDGEGNYSVDGFSHGSNYFITASKEGVMVTPPKVIINKLDNNRTVNFSAVVQKFSISGTVTDFNGELLKSANIEIRTTFDTIKAVTNAKGKYVVDNMPMALTYTMTAEKDGYIPSESFVIETLDKSREVNFKIRKEKEQKGQSKPAVKHERSSDGKTKIKEESVKREDRTKLRPVRNPVKERSESKKPEPIMVIVPKEDKKSKAEQEKLEKKQKEEREKNEEQENKRIAEEQKEKEAAEKARLAAEKKAAQEQAKAEALARKQEEALAAARLAEEQRVKAEAERQAAKKEKTRQDEQDAELAARNAELAEQEKLEKKQREEREKNEERENKRRAEQEKIEQKKAEEQEKLAKAKQKESDESARKARTYLKKDNKTSSSAREESVVSAPQERVSAGKDRMVKVRGKIESLGESLQNIEIFMSSAEEEFSTKTDERGRYEISVPAGRKYILKPIVSNFYLEPSEMVYEDLKSNVIQDFSPYITVEGEVFADGRAVADAPVSLNGAHVTSTNQFGKYKIEKIDYGMRAVISVYKSGVVFYPNSAEISKAVNNHENVNFIVSYSISGKVSAQGGGTVSNMNIEVTGSTATSVTTDFGGNFVILGLAQGGSFEITPKAGGYSFTPTSRTFADLRESFVGQNFSAVKETYTIRGNVNIGGKPIRNAVVSISKRALKYYTDDEGNFNIGGLDYGTYTLSVFSRDHQFEPITVELDKNTAVQFSTDISLGGVVLSGKKPISGVTVDVNGKKHKTDENGKYLVTGLKYNGDYLLSLSAPGVIFSPSQKEYSEVKRSVLNEIFNASAIINGRVTFNGKGLGGALITMSGSPETYKSDSNGYFLIQNVQLGQDYTLEISCPGYKFDPPKREYKNLEGGKMAENFKASVDGLSIKGTVTAGGRPLKKVNVVIEGTAKSQTVTDEDGVFMFDGLAANKRYELTVLSKNHKFEVPSAVIERLDTDKEINLEPGQTASVVSVGEEPGTKAAPEARPKRTYFKVSGKVTVDGVPLKNVLIKNKLGDTATNASGDYTIPVEAGDTIEVTPSLAGYVFSPEKLVVEDIKAAASNMNFRANSNSHSLSGQIVNKDLKGIKGVSVKDLNSEDDFMTDSRGNYKVTGLLHQTSCIIVPDSGDYNFYPENVEFSIDQDLEANDIYAYPKKLRKAEAFVYGGKNSSIDINENYVSVVMVSPEGGKVSVKIRDGKNVIKEFETNLSANAASVIDWDGQTGTGSQAAEGSYSVLIEGSGFKGDVLNFKVF
ncbi:MAG: carboxypeptidase regulatory-like domain-containing protein [Endomicrobia bacterium]|nr:carboxypeptidase regulatory-like domain-containing protein [Endomicrobiia bacterium]